MEIYEAAKLDMKIHVTFPELEVDCMHNYYVVTPNNRHNPRVKAFVAWLKEQVAS